MTEYKSFRLFRYSPPAKMAPDYSEAEKDEFRAAFGPVARRERIFGRVFLVLVIAGFLLFIFSKQNDMWWLFCGVILLAISYAVLFGPVCPACKRRIDDGVRKFCPECGSSDLTPRSFLLWARCHSCGTELRQRKGRSYKIRCCTHCGVFLDAKGI
jgi:hypothetical protein